MYSEKSKSYWRKKNKWVVIEDHPRPDDYIVIMAPGWDGETVVSKSLHHSEISAKGRARYLMGKFEARKIKVFYPDGRSRTFR